MKLKLYPPILMFLGIGVIIMLAKAAQTMMMLGPVFNEPALEGLGWVFILAGALPNLQTIRKFKANKTTIIPDGAPSALMVDGLFAYSRNPIYVGMTMILLGTVFLNGAMIGLTVIPVFMALVQTLWIRYEENALEEIFGQSYLDYKIRVRRWL